MGQGHAFKCKKCGHEYSVHPGVGMMYPSVFREKLAEIAEGAYGTEFQDLINNTDYAAIDASRVVYICSFCNRWELGTDVTLYTPNDPESIAKKQYGILTVEEWGYVPYVAHRDLEREYHVLKRYYYKCEKCGRRMHKASDEEEKNLSCPKCGEPNRADDKFIFWD